ncbi:hypothetical protein ATH_1164 [Aliarcobacter thereius LMG 24486]|nr:hypothetical protein ATH_1164 [Aliarcobacter thereius LMG 24486]
MFLFFSHQLTEEQKKDAEKHFDIDNFINLPQNLQEIFSNVPNDLENLDNYIKPIKEFLKENAKKDDLVLIQGDFGVTYILVNFAKSLYLNPVYSTTSRVVQEFEEGGKLIKKSIFKHQMFRKYE